jgi:dTDP-4-dehydrorhamnose reductase
MPDLEMWGGLECSVARIGDQFRNQIIETGHYSRIEDLDRLAELGLRTVRYPVIWETIATDRPEACDWRWHDERLHRLKALGIRVIAGLVHHGSGPRYTDLLDPAFPGLLAAHATNVAQRYPWIEFFTPVNEPLTTARFSALYGHWYPHARDNRSFMRALLNQCRAVALAMKAIRRITPSAKLVQTEDVGKVFSSPGLRYQADFENARRWLSLDVLCGNLDREHRLYAFVVAQGIEAAELERFRQEPCVPDVVGMNHYLTSERYLHYRMGAFPTTCSASNGRDRYADVEAVRMPVSRKDIGPKARLGEVWNRYKLPVAVTEVHLGCTREEQLRWLAEVWQAALELRRTGADIRAITSWSLFGAFDWNSLLMRNAGCYEAGAFDIRSGPPRITAVGKAVRSLALHGHFSHPVLRNSPGWWHRPERLYRRKRRGGTVVRSGCRPSLIFVGDNALWLRACERAAHARGLGHLLVAGGKLDGDDPDALVATLRPLHPWALLDTRGRAAGPLDCENRSALSVACGELGAQFALVSDEQGPELQACDPDASHGMFAVRDLAADNGPWQAWREAPLIFRGLPSGVDSVIDLIIDGAQGVWSTQGCTVRQPARP